MPEQNHDGDGSSLLPRENNESIAAFGKESRSTTIIVMSSIFIALTIVAISLRFYSRRTASIKLWWDDWLALASIPFALTPSIISILKTPHGFGRHEMVVSQSNPHHLTHYGLHLYILFLFYNLSLALFKLSFLALYLRFFAIVRKMRICTKALMVLISLWAVWNEFMFAFRCTPVNLSWISADGTCFISKRALFICQSVPTILFDIAIIVLPIRLVWRIQMDRPTRIALVPVFLLGGLVTITSIVRLVYALKSYNSDVTCKLLLLLISRVKLMVIGSYVDLILWSSAEPVIGLICCCLPTYGPLLRMFRNQIGLISKLGNPLLRASDASRTLVNSAQMETIGTKRTLEIQRLEHDVDDADIEACSGIRSVKIESLPGDRQSVTGKGTVTVTTDVIVRESK